MLLSFRLANHRSLLDEQQLLLTPQYPADQPAAVAQKAVRVAGIFGANAAGKSNVLDALDYMRHMVVRSYRESEPSGGVKRFPFALDPEVGARPSRFVVDFLGRDSVHYTYGFAVDGRRVAEEWLYSYPKQLKRIIFEREGDDYSYGEGSPSAFRQVAAITDANVLFLSVASRSRQQLVVPAYEWFRWNVRAESLTDGGLWGLDTQLASAGSYVSEVLAPLLRAADTGIEDLEFREPDDEELDDELTFFELLEEAETPEERDSIRYRLRKERRKAAFAHRGPKGIKHLSVQDQSLGTQALLSRGLDAARALRRGSVLAVDELDASLHPFLSAEIIRLFRDSRSNPHNAQLIFTSHDATLLGRIQGEEVLQRDEVWFVEKNESGATELYPLTDFKLSQEENRERRYLAGRYGAVPDVQQELFVKALEAREDSSGAEKS
jgi:uncharacterized protein